MRLLLASIQRFGARRFAERAFTLAAMALAVAGSAMLGQAGGARAQNPAVAPGALAPATGPAGCGRPLSQAVYDAWQGVGGEGGRLGCPTTPESAAPTSAQGSADRTATFGLNGEIVLHVSGPRAGQAIVVSGCFFRLYSQFGGPSGWLGLPIADAENTPDGSRQSFEGGRMRYARTLDACEADPAAPAPAPVTTSEAPASLAPLDLFENAATGDRLSLADRASIDDALAAGYQRLRGQARVMSAAGDGETPLKLFLDDAHGLRQTLATDQSQRDALSAGFAFEAGQGFVWTLPHPGAVTLKLYRDPVSGHARLTAGEGDETEAKAAGYRFVRIEGYAATP